jgi:hypothetical protein
MAEIEVSFNDKPAGDRVSPRLDTDAYRLVLRHPIKMPTEPPE